MRRSGTTVLLTAIILLATASLANASSHGGMPSDLSLWQTIRWQFDDFAAHMSMTFEAIRLMLVSPSLGWSMLDGAICGDKTHWAHALFDTADHALENFFSIVMILAWVGIEVAARIVAFIAALMPRHTQARA
jgi:hypothetical protein